MNIGYEKGNICNRNGCQGIIDEHERHSCNCHINPPCSACTENRRFCPVCDWNGSEEQKEVPITNSYGQNTSIYKEKTIDDLDKTKIDYLIKPHTNFSQIVEGVYPENTTIEEVGNKVMGTFGGRFDYFEKGKFRYIAYTD